MLFIVSLILAACLTSFLLTGANIAIQRKDNRAYETCECGKSITLSCIFKKNTFAVEWMDAYDIKPIAKCLKQVCSLNPDYVEKYNISFDMEQGYFDLTVRKVTMQLNGRKLVCSDGSNTASYNMSVKDYEPYLTDDSKSGSIKAASGCISQDTQVSFKWIKIYASSNVEMEFNPKRPVKSITSCTNDSDCGNDMHVYYSEIIEAKASAEGKYYLKVTAIYGNESKESFSANNYGQKYIIEEQDEEQLKSDSVYIVVIATLYFLACAVTVTIITVTIIVYRKKFRNRKRSYGKEDNKGNDISSSLCHPENGEKVNSEKYVKNVSGNTSDEDCSFRSTDDWIDLNTDETNQCLQNLPQAALIPNCKDSEVNVKVKTRRESKRTHFTGSKFPHNYSKEGKWRRDQK